MAVTEISVSKIYILATEPTNKIKDRFWFDTTNNLLKRYDGTSWKPISVSSDDVVVLSSGNKVSLTNYLNTQIAALAEGIDSKQDKLKFYSEVDKSSDTSSTAEASKLTLKTSASQYGGSKINIFASQGEFASGKINLTSQAYANSGDGGEITLLSDGVAGDGGEITLKAKTLGSSPSYPGGNINIIAESTQNSTGSNILLSAKSIQLDGGLNGTALNTSIPANIDDNHILTTKAVKTELDKKQNKLSHYSETSSSSSTPSGIIYDTHIESDFGVYITTDNNDITLDPTGNINLNATKVQKNGVDIATTTDLATKQNTLQFYIESGEGPTGTSKITAYNFEVSSAQIKLDSEYGIDGNILEKTISETSSDTKIPTAKAVKTELDKKQNKLEGYSEILPENGGVETIKIVTNTGDDSLTLQSRKLIFNGDISGTGISTSIPAFASSVNTKIPSEKAVRTELDKKQDALNCYRETASGEAIISNATSFSVVGTSDGLIVENNNGGITIRSNSFKAGQAVISLEANTWKDGSNAILFSVDGVGIKLSDAFLIPEIKNKQDSTDTSLETIDKTIVGAINELNNQVNTTIPEPITSVYTISSTALSSIISNTSYTGVSGQILISADVENTGPILIGEGITDKANAFPIYPDQIFPIPFSDINNFKVAGNIGNKFNYIISFRSLNNTSPAVNGGITILNENGYYKLTPSGEGETATLTITKLK